MSSLSRRLFLARSAGVATGVLGLAAGPVGAIEPLRRPRSSHLKLSMAAYSYRQYLQGLKRTMDLFDFVTLAADMGLDGVELTSYYFPPDVDVDTLHRLKQHAFSLGLDVSGTSVGNNFCVPPGPGRDGQIKLVKTWIDHAAELDAPVIRIFGGNPPKERTLDEAIGDCVEAIELSLPYAAEKGVALALENHGGVTATPELLTRIVKAVHAPAGNFGVNLDVGNFRGEDPYADMAAMVPYAINVHMKTEISPGESKPQPADLARIIGILRDGRYSGYISLEYEATEDPMKAVPEIMRTLRTLVS